MTIPEIIDYIEREWPEVTDPKHCATLCRNAHDEKHLDQLVCFYERNLHVLF